ncbi:restriction endonuclease subunit S [Pseudomonas sp. B21-054]|uniref:restriction endonuclease subunit S n=1 Tax=Pseudomonas sp. B21-054 TaxID=2895494 RepID=UPI00222EAF4E|nr:restriction endonuclease subunit S [Pseudomonas sp. B21-054]UZE17307.1 restriction endonuclease subunit S [Pseudomonas sp. B21-054]
MVPEGWKRAPLESVAEIRTGVAKGKSGLKDPITVPYLRVANVQDGRLDLSVVKTIEIERSQLERYSLKKGDVLMNEGGDFDKLGRGDVWSGQIETCLHQNHVFAVRPNQKVITPYFLAALAGSHYGKSFFLSCAKKSTNLASINSSQLKEFQVLIPPLDEQYKIAKILSTWDRSIAIAERLLGNRQRQKKALTQQLLTGKQRIFGFHEAWRMLPLGESFRERVETGFFDLPLLSITSEDGVVNRESVGRKDTSNSDKSKYLRICPNDIGYNTMRMWQGVSGLSSQEGIVSPAYTILIPQPDVDPLFSSYLFKFPSLVHVFCRHSQGLVSDTWNLKYSNFAKIKWLIPGIDEQKAIAKVLSAADHELSALTQRLVCLKQEKKALMQQLLTGKRRVKVDAMEVA